MSKQKIDPDAGGPWDVGMERVPLVNRQGNEYHIENFATFVTSATEATTKTTKFERSTLISWNRRSLSLYPLLRSPIWLIR